MAAGRQCARVVPMTAMLFTVTSNLAVMFKNQTQTYMRLQQLIQLYLTEAILCDIARGLWRFKDKLKRIPRCLEGWGAALITSSLRTATTTKMKCILHVEAPTKDMRHF